MKKYNIRLTKSLGQNFLIDESVIKRIADAANLTKDDLVIEVGAGIGNMTCELAKRAGRVVAVEIDRHLIPALSENLNEFPNVHIIHEDILKLDLKKLNATLSTMGEGDFTPSSIKVVANLPYYITTPIIMKFLEDVPEADLMMFMVQKEVAERMASKPGGKNYGALSVAVQYYAQPEKVFDVPPHCFLPQPDVDSSVVRLTVHKFPPVALLDRELFFKTIRAAFGQRRKTLLNALFNSGYFTLTKEEIKEILLKLGIKENHRGETLSIMQFAQIANSFSKKDC